jgi:hypothetical protein
MAAGRSSAVLFFRVVPARPFDDPPLTREKMRPDFPPSRESEPPYAEPVAKCLKTRRPKLVAGHSLTTKLPTILKSVSLFLCLQAASIASGGMPQVAWIEDFATNPIANNRFGLDPMNAVDRFAYGSGQALLTVHYNSYQPSAWCFRPIDPATSRTLGRYDDFEFSVAFRIRSENLSTEGFAQIAWGLINSQTTGKDRAGCSPAGPYAYDCVTFDYFPTTGYTTLAPTIIHSDAAQGFWSSIDFSMGAETLISQAGGEEGITPDQIYTARLRFDGFWQVATLTIRRGDHMLGINVDGASGYGGPDSDPTTIQTFVYIDSDFTVDTFALTAWEDTCPYAPVIADVDVFRIEFLAPAVLPGDMNHDGLVDGRDIGPFLEALMSSQFTAGAVARGDFSGNGTLDPADIAPFAGTLTQP